MNKNRGEIATAIEQRKGITTASTEGPNILATEAFVTKSVILIGTKLQHVHHIV